MSCYHQKQVESLDGVIKQLGITGIVEPKLCFGAYVSLKFDVDLVGCLECEPKVKHLCLIKTIELLDEFIEMEKE